MSKKLLLVALALVAFMSAQAQGTHPRRVLVEEFTNASCPPCASQNPAFNTKLNDNAAILTAIKYQTSWPGVDPMNAQTAPEVAARVSYYGVNGVPNAFLDGTGVVNDCGAYANAPACMDPTELVDENNNLTPVTIDVVHVVASDFGSVEITVKVKSDEAITGDLRLRVAATEEVINFTAAPGTNGEKDFSDVMRKMLPNPDGTKIASFAAGEEKIFTFKWTPANYYNLNKIKIAAWLQDDDSKEIWQSNLSAPNTQIPGGSFAKITLGTSQTNKLNCLATFAPAFTLKNTAPVGITSADIIYNVDGGPWSSYQWTGTLNSNITTPVVLPAVTFDKTGTHQIKIQVVKTSAGLLLNQVDGSNSAVIFAMYGSTPIPSGQDFEGDFPPAGVAIKNESPTLGWVFYPQASGAFGNSAKAIACNFYNIANGKSVDMYLPRMDLTGVTKAKLTFDHAKAFYVGTDGTFKDDRLLISVSTNCGSTWTNIFDKKGDALTTKPDGQANAYLPADEDWVSNEVDMTPYAGQAEVLLRFRGTSNFANNLYMDNINVAATSGVSTLKSLNNFAIQPNPTQSMAELRFGLDKPESITMLVYGLDGSLVQSLYLGNLPTGDHVTLLDASQIPTGSYRVVLQGKEGSAQTQWIVLK